jgi:DNA-binding transcriptional MerR regulator
MDLPDPMSDSRALFAISVAADLVGTGVQNLRAYERRGLVEPQRTPGGTRLYAPADIARLRRITELLGMGLNLAGVESVLALEVENARLRAELELARSANDPMV